MFVSHNMGAIKQLCKRSVLLEGGEVKVFGETRDVLDQYLKKVDAGVCAELNFPIDKSKDFQVIRARLLNEEGVVCGEFECDEDIVIDLECIVNKDDPVSYAYIDFKKNEKIILVSDNFDYSSNLFNNLSIGRYFFQIIIPKRTLGVGKYKILINFLSKISMINELDSIKKLVFILNDSNTKRGNKRLGYFSTLLKWKKKYEDQ